MKNYILIVLISLFTSASIAQSARSSVKKVNGEENTKEYKNKQRDLYNHWSIEALVGTNKPVEPFTPGYYASDPNRFSNIGTIDHFGIGVRYMTSNLFGFKVGLMYDKINNISSSKSLPFALNMYTATIEGVINIGRIARFETFTNRFNFLVHAGMQTTYKMVKERAGIDPGADTSTEQDGGIIFGVMPEYKISNKISITADFAYLANFRQHMTWDGGHNPDRNLNGSIYNMALGLNFSLGSNKEKMHADWYVLDADGNAATQNRIDALESKLKDTDKDGVPDYLDLEKNTVAGATVDTKGRTVQTISIPTNSSVNANNNNNVVTTKEIPVNQNIINELLEKGYFNVFFDISKDYPNNSSTQNVYQVIHYLKQNPDVKVKLVGHTDKTGDAAANQDLSERRAKSVFNLITGSGIAANRVSIEGLGVDNDVPSDVKAGNNMARRVSIILIK